MPSLTDTLRIQHRQLEAVAFDLDEALVREDREDIGYALVKLNRALSKHLEVEELELYNALSEVAEQSRLDVASNLAVDHARSLVALDSRFKNFFQRHSGAQGELDLLKREWLEVRDLLFQRIRTEEDVLYPTFESWMAGSGRKASGG